MAALSAAPIPDLSEESDELDEPDLSDEEPDWLDESSVLSLESLWELSLEPVSYTHLELAKLVASAGQCGGHTGAHCLFPPNLEAGASKTMRGVLVTRRGSRLPDVAMAVSAISVC